MKVVIDESTYRPRTQRVTCWPLSRHFSGFGSFFLHLIKAKFSDWHLSPMCFEEAINTADVGIGSPAALTALSIPRIFDRLLLLIQYTTQKKEEKNRNLIYLHSLCLVSEKMSKCRYLFLSLSVVERKLSAASRKNRGNESGSVGGPWRKVR